MNRLVARLTQQVDEADRQLRVDEEPHGYAARMTR
jgi:hypothetical protein